MNAKEQIEKILAEVGLKAPTFAKKIGVKYQLIYDIQQGKTKKISGTVADLIVSTYPEFNMVWLLTAKGEMLKTADDNSSRKSESSETTGENIYKDMYEDELEINKMLKKEIAYFKQNIHTLKHRESVKLSTLEAEIDALKAQLAKYNIANAG